MEMWALVVVIFILLGYLLWSHFIFVEEIRRLTELYNAKDLHEVAALESVRKTPEDKPEVVDEFAAANITDEQWQKLIKQQVHG